MKTRKKKSGYSAGAFREWLKQQAIDETFVMKMLHDQVMADATMKTLDDLPAGVIERLWQTQERILLKWKMTTGKVIAVDGVPIEQWRASRARSRAEKDWRFKK